MKLVKVRFDRVFGVVRMTHDSPRKNYTHFGFESNGKRIFSAGVQGSPKLEPGMTVVALLKEPDNWGSFLGWVDCTDASIAYRNLDRGFIETIGCSYFSISGWIYYIRTQRIIALICTFFFGSIALLLLYHFVRNRLINRALLQIRDEVLKQLAQDALA